MSESVSVVRNSYEDDSASTGRSEDGAGDLVDAATRYLQRHDVNVRLPWGARVSMSPRALDQDKLDISLDFGSQEEQVAEAEQGTEARHRKYREYPTNSTTTTAMDEGLFGWAWGLGLGWSMLDWGRLEKGGLETSACNEDVSRRFLLEKTYLENLCEKDVSRNRW